MTALQRPGQERSRASRTRPPEPQFPPNGNRSLPITRRRRLVGLTALVLLGTSALIAPAAQAGITPAAVLAQPGQPIAVAGDGEATVTVTPGTSGSVAAHYLVWAVNNASSSCYVHAPETSCTIPYLYNDIPVTFESVAFNAGYTEYSVKSVASAPVTPRAAGSTTTPTPETGPSLPAPTQVSAVAGTSSVTASWSAGPSPTRRPPFPAG